MKKESKSSKQPFMVISILTLMLSLFIITAYEVTDVKKENKRLTFDKTENEKIVGRLKNEISLLNNEKNLMINNNYFICDYYLSSLVR